MIPALLAITFAQLPGMRTTPIPEPKTKAKVTVHKPKPKPRAAKPKPVVQRAKPVAIGERPATDNNPVVASIPRFSDKPAGSGPPSKKGDIVTIQFLVTKKGGPDLADSKKRGLPYTFRIGDAGNDPLLDLVVKGMKIGAVRTATVLGKDAYGPGGAPPVISANDTLIVTITLLRRGDK
jgi:FKBP-type peptidyl-prolyl cis-trans isomerase